MKNYLLHKDIRFTLVSAVVTCMIIAVPLGLFEENHRFWVIALILLALFSPIKRKYTDLKNTSPLIGKRLFLSRVGYVFFGITIALLFSATFFNIGLGHGLFDFRDIGFLVISEPLISFFHAALNTRFVLYGVSLVNLLFITVIVDFVGFLFHTVFNSGEQG